MRRSPVGRVSKNSLAHEKAAAAAASVANRPGQPSVRWWPSLRVEARAGLKQPEPAPASNHPNWAAWLRKQDGPVGPVSPSLA